MHKSSLELYDQYIFSQAAREDRLGEELYDLSLKPANRQILYEMSLIGGGTGVYFYIMGSGTMQVILEGTTSHTTCVDSGIPQGTVIQCLDPCSFFLTSIK